jgi:hypothetical protein
MEKTMSTTTRTPAVHGQPLWVARFRWPETFRFKHLLRHQPFAFAAGPLTGQTFVRLSARRFVPATVHINGSVTIHDRPVRCVDSINVPVCTGGL